VITELDPADIVRRGVFQVMEAGRVFEHLSVEDNLRAGATPAAGSRWEATSSRCTSGFRA
jgi:ABC-type branched-subunit amino acid transport system ATPase component